MVYYCYVVVLADKLVAKAHSVRNLCDQKKSSIRPFPALLANVVQSCSLAQLKQEPEMMEHLL